MKTAEEVMKDFFQCILEVIAKNSSKNYGLIIFKDIKKRLANDFPLLRLVEFTDSSIKIQRSTKSVEPKEMVRLFNKIIDALGPDILKLFIKQQLDSEDLEYLKKIGVKLNGF